MGLLQSPVLEALLRPLVLILVLINQDHVEFGCFSIAVALDHCSGNLRGQSKDVNRQLVCGRGVTPNDIMLAEKPGAGYAI